MFERYDDKSTRAPASAVSRSGCRSLPDERRGRDRPIVALLRESIVLREVGNVSGSVKYRHDRERPALWVVDHEIREARGASSRLHFFKAADQLSTIVTGTDRASSVALLIRKR